MNEPYSDSVSPNLAPQPRQQMGAAAELRWRFFVNFLRTLGGRLELSSRIFLGIGFVGGGIGGARGRSGVVSGVARGSELCCGLCFCSGNSSLMATDRESRVSQPASFSAELPIVLSHPPGLWLADPATAVSSLRLLGIATGVGVARPRLLPWTAIALSPSLS